MKLQNKKTGEIVYIDIQIPLVDGKEIKGAYSLNNLAELNEEWEDYEEPKKYYYITSCGEITHRGYRLWENESLFDKKRKEIGNYFGTEEEAEQAVKKLKAYKRLKDRGFKFFNNKIIGEYGNVSYRLTCPITNTEEKDLDLLFGGEE